MTRRFAVPLALLLIVLGSSAQAGGWLADTFVKPFSPPAAKALDDAHKKLGNPLDHAANVAVGTAANAIAPGTGPA